jgi:hypothetical protein
MARVKSTAHPCDAAEMEGVLGAENPTRAPTHEDHADSLSVNNGFEFGYESEVGSQGAKDPGAGVTEGSRSYYFGPSTVTVSRIREMSALNYFVKGNARMPGEETISEPLADEAVVFEEFFTAGLWMPPHRTLAEILLKFQVQLHQLTPNAIAQLSKYLWAVSSF